ncbi:hypothetical protein MMC14_008189 [Varicellaria rhodocarpa]|nr:hypothetical protein [Varicellaria rhodocarpa]
MTDLYTSGGPANLGALGVSPRLKSSRVPTFLAEWAALIPLLCHLTSRHHDHQFIGEVSLAGSVYISLFPKLGVLKGITQLLEEGSEFLDRASSIGGRCSEVWDVNWGSVFPCANGAASAMVAACALQKGRQAIRIPEFILLNVSPNDAHSTPVESDDDAESTSSRKCLGLELGGANRNRKKRLTIHDNVELSTLGSSSLNSSSTRGANQHLSNYLPSTSSKEQFRRYQTLHVMKFGRDNVKIPWYRLFSYSASARWYQVLSSILLGCSASVLCLYGLYGTAGAVLFGAISRLACSLIQIQRPPGFLENNELQKACMLVGVHQNSSVWYLYIGDRGVVDTLLNKTMVIISGRSSVLLCFFRVFHIFQLLSMSYVAAEKGWDGISMVFFMLIAEGFMWCGRDLQVAKHWLGVEGITVEAKSFEFSGRTPMVGAIQRFSGSKNSRWMDDLVCPSPRREAWLERLGVMTNSEPSQKYDDLGEFDKRWVDINVTLGMRAADLLQAQFSNSERRS